MPIIPCRHYPPGAVCECGPCSLYRNKPHYRVIWNGSPDLDLSAIRAARNAVSGWSEQARISDPPTPTPRGPCSHLGPYTGDAVKCGTCPGSKRLKLYECARHGRCTLDGQLPGVPSCHGCRDYQSDVTSTASTFPVRDLAYYVLPVSGMGTWQRNIAKLLRYWPLFTGRKVIAIVTSAKPIKCQDDSGATVYRGVDHPDAVKAMLADCDCEFIEIENDTNLRETKAIGPLFERLVSHEPGRCIFFAHAKGVSRPVNPGVSVHPWTDLLYESNLGYWPIVESLLAKYPTAGSLKKLGNQFSGSKSQWHYSGSFFWLRSADLFSRNWRHCDLRWWGIESWPSLHYGIGESGCIFHENHGPQLDMYNMDYIKNVVHPQWEKWKLEHVRERTVIV